MGRTLLAAVGMLALPLLVFAGVGLMLQWATGKVRLPQHKAINVSLHYSVGDVETYWRTYQGRSAQANPMSSSGGAGTLLDAEHRYLQLDLIFPFLYGGALAASLLWVWIALGRPFHPAWFVVPVALVLLGDWTENLIQLSQMQRFLRGEALQGAWIALASTATAIKVLCLSGGYLALVLLVLAYLRGAFRSP